MSLYFWINILSISVPFLVSFHPRIKLYKNWGPLFLAMILAMVPFIVWDIYFTEKGYWGFNPDYLSGTYLFNLPIEEWLFFICIPYSCIFMQLALIELSPKWIISHKTANIISYALFLLFAGVLVVNTDKMYTLFDMSYALLVLGHVFFIEAVAFLYQFLQPYSRNPNTYLFTAKGAWRDPIEKLWRLSLNPLLREYLSGLDQKTQTQTMKKLKEAFRP